MQIPPYLDANVFATTVAPSVATSSPANTPAPSPVYTLLPAPPGGHAPPLEIAEEPDLMSRYFSFVFGAPRHPL